MKTKFVLPRPNEHGVYWFGHVDKTKGIDIGHLQAIFPVRAIGNKANWGRYILSLGERGMVWNNEKGTDMDFHYFDTPLDALKFLNKEYE